MNPFRLVRAKSHVGGPMHASIYLHTFPVLLAANAVLYALMEVAVKNKAGNWRTTSQADLQAAATAIFNTGW